jgi:DNA-binding NtrC family response regulator
MRHQILNIGLVGQKVSDERTLVGELKSRHRVTLMKHEHALVDYSILDALDVLVLDCGEIKTLGMGILQFLKHLKLKFLGLSVVLVNGSITQKEIAAAFQEGVIDYFPDPYEVKLIIERLEVLGVHSRKATSM